MSIAAAVRFSAVGLLVAIGCGGSDGADAGVDAGPDREDAGPDAGGMDGGRSDAGGADAGSDAGAPDAGDGDSGTDAGSADAGAPTWQIDDVGPVGTAEHYTAIATSGGAVHILYFDPVGHDLEHAWAATPGATFTLETVAEAGWTGWWPSASFDSTGRLHAFWHRFSPDLDVAHGVRSVAGTWTGTTVDGPHDVGWTVRGLVDEADRRHAAHMDDTDGDLRYATDAPTGWAVEDVPSSANLAMYAIAARGGVAYLLAGSDADGVVLLERTAAGSWSREDVAASREASAGGGLAVDAAGRVHACFDDYATGSVFYAVRDGGAWSVEPLAERTPPVSDALDCALALDSTDRPHVAYTASSGGMWHGVRDGVWTRTEVDGAESSAVSIAVDAADHPHIAYVAYATPGTEVRHATLR